MSTDLHKIRLVMDLRGAGVMDTKVLSAIERTPRELFVPPYLQDRAYENTALPIGFDQTISQPLVVARMAAALRLDERLKLLEVGTGSGYNAAVLARLVRRVYTIERHRRLALDAERRFAALGLHNVTVLLGDGFDGWPLQAPFDRIALTAATPTPPPHLLDQLADGGVMVAPIGRQHQSQHLTRFTKGPATIVAEPMGEVRFVPMVQGLAETDRRRTAGNG